MLANILKGITRRPARTRIAFERTGEHVPGCPRGIYTIDPDGEDCRLIRTSGECPRWSPDGRRIAFVEGTKDNGGLPSVFVMNPNGEDVRRLTCHHDVSVTPACWSPDSRRLAYSLWLWHENRSALCIVDIATKTWKQVLYTEDQIYPTWSPSNSIMFSLYSGGTVPRLFEVRPETTRSTECSDFLPGDSEPIWAFDGSSVVFGRDGGLVVRNAGGQDQFIRTRGTAIQWAISPDGLRVVYAAQGTRGAGFEPFVVSLPHQSHSNLITNPIVDDHEVDTRYVSWSPWL